MSGIFHNIVWFESLPFWGPVVVVPLNRSGGLLETDVVEASKRRSADVFDGVIWNQELFLLQQGNKVERFVKKARADKRKDQSGRGRLTFHLMKT